MAPAERVALRRHGVQREHAILDKILQRLRLFHRHGVERRPVPDDVRENQAGGHEHLFRPKAGRGPHPLTLLLLEDAGRKRRRFLERRVHRKHVQHLRWHFGLFSHCLLRLRAPRHRADGPIGALDFFTGSDHGQEQGGHRARRVVADG